MARVHHNEILGDDDPLRSAHEGCDVPVEYKDYYKILGVAKTATEKEIKAAYRKLARKHHPDVNPGNKQAEAKFKEINEAYEVLSDPEKRQRYEEVGSDWSSYASRGPSAWPPGGGGRVHVNRGFGQENVGDFSDFFRTIFGGGFGGGGAPEGFGGFGRGGADAAMPGQDLEHGIDLSLEEVLRGATRTLRIGDGAEASTVEVKIPAGMREGSRVRVAGKGGHGFGGGRGDLYLKVHILPDSRFDVKENDLHTTFTVPLTIAVLGGEAEVPTLDGTISIKIPAESPNGRVFRLRGQGLPSGGTRGDLRAELSVELPKSLSAREKELFEELRRGGR
jgi:DnaJ-class molecular chaperone